MMAADTMKTLRQAVFAMMLALIWPGEAAAVQCKLTVSPIDFGIYMPMTPAPVDIIGQISVRCQAQPGTFAVLIGAGLSGDQMSRHMTAGGASLLYYNLYRDAARMEIWGEVSPPTFTVTGDRQQKDRPTYFSLPVYGRIFANQAPEPGVYNDNLLVTVLF